MASFHSMNGKKRKSATAPKKNKLATQTMMAADLCSFSKLSETKTQNTGAHEQLKKKVNKHKPMRTRYSWPMTPNAARNNDIDAAMPP